ncbi:interferon-induced protein 44-like [Megalops cyprinoides]|uniref:interferon-induced protein 44-like n=1 Tax=Megalops cyprinoides TaxID=118141 RepID=UPI001863BE3B|nr:interferon-induced protein 44-like [Megalops cyprinoides]
MQFITSYKPSCESVPEARVLLLGPVGAGKSSFISSVHSVFSGRATNRAMVGSSSTSFTQKLRSYTIRGRGESADQPTSLVFCDAMGLGEGEMSGLTLHDTLAIIKGHAPDGHKFSAEHPVWPETVGYVKKPSQKERVHCVAFVVDASKIDSYSKGMGNTFRQLREHISDLGVHQVALLTHVDKVCQEAARDITKVYRSRLLQHTMEKAGALLGMCTSYIVPVKNYSCELDVDEHTNTLLLSAVSHILQYVDLYFQDVAENKSLAGTGQIEIIKSIMSVLSSNLSSKQEKQLCALFEHSRLHLIYKASVHGYSAANFHQKCDHQGPTITVAYNKAGFVFGGYTSKNYAQTGQNVYDDKAFLFSIRDRNIILVQATDPQYAFTDANNTGPNFAGNLIFLYQSRAAVYSNPGNYYNFNAAEMHGNDLQLTECEVYRVEEHDLLDKPWRNIEWDSAMRKELVDSIKNYKPSISSVDQARVVLIGPIGAGKSSFFNSINSIFQGHVTCRAMCGSAGTSLTTQFRTYSIKAGKDGKPLPIILCDTMGLEENTGAGLDVDDITSILKGHVPDRYQFNPSGPLQSKDDQFHKSVDLQDKIHCVAYVMDCCKVTLISSKLEEKLAAIRKKVNRMAIPQLVLLTKVDEACSCVADNIENVYHCQYIERKIQEVSVRLGIPVSCVVPVKSYSRELELEPSCDVLLLSAVQQMLRFADNYFDDICE